MKSKLLKWSAGIAALSLAMAGTVTGLEDSRQEVEFVAHEWGTFTAISAGDGKVLAWQSQNGRADLPSFVYSTGSNRSGLAFKARAMATVRMETPVVYFYGDDAQTVSVTATLPKG